MAAELTSVTLVKSQLGITASTYDTILGTLSINAERLMANMVDRRDDSSGMVGTTSSWLSASHTQNIPGAIWNAVQLRYWPVTTITSVLIYTSVSSSTTLGSYLYRIDQDTRTLRFLGQQPVAWDGGFIAADYPYAVQTIQTVNSYPYTAVAYTGGFTAGSIPDDLEQAATELTCQMFLRRKRDASLQSETLGKYSYTAGDPKGWADYLDTFRETWMMNYMGIGGGVV